MTEAALVSAIARAAGAAPAGVTVGIGDDAAVLGDGTVLATDMLVDGVHFHVAGAAPADLGHRAAAATLSDLAAMGAEPLCVVACFGLPEGFDDVAGLAAGIAEHGVPLVGGDLSRAPALTLAIAGLGRAERPVLRSGGRPGDVLAVTGPLGGQAASGYTARVVPRLDAGRRLAAVATAMIDLSDGIAGDVRRLAEASGTGAVVELERLPRAPGATLVQAAAGGEDFELLAALPASLPLPAGMTAVGRLTGDGRVRLLEDGLERELGGFDHFAAR